MTWRVHEGDCLKVLPTLPAGWFHCAVTSPPYFGLRSYLKAGDALKPLEIGSERTPAEYVAKMVAGVSVATTGWEAGCKCNAGDPVPCRVLDPFSGAGTTLLAAVRTGRDAVGVELNPAYAKLARERLVEDNPLFNSAFGEARGKEEATA